MANITGLGGVFVKCENMKKTMDWYEEILGFDMRDEVSFTLKGAIKENDYAVLGFFGHEDDYFSPSVHEYMINFRVDDLEGFARVLDAKGVKLIGDVTQYQQGKFAWIMDPDGRKLELWEPACGE